MIGTSDDRSYMIATDRERERLRALVARLGDAELTVQVNEHWTIAGVLAHVAFWDARALVLIGKLERDEPSRQTTSSRTMRHGSTTRSARLIGVWLPLRR